MPDVHLLRADAGRLPLRDGSVGMIVTDPPWSRDFLPTLARFADEAHRVLRMGGFITMMIGKTSLDKAMRVLTEAGFSYYWLFIASQGNSNLKFFPRKVLEKFRPALIYSKGHEPSRQNKWFRDLMPSVRDKKFHAWGQDPAIFAHLIEKLSREDDMILDPFCGGGSVGEAAMRVGRRVLLCDLSPYPAAKRTGLDAWDRWHGGNGKAAEAEADLSGLPLFAEAGL